MKRYLLIGSLLVLLFLGAFGYFSLSDLRSKYTVPPNDQTKVEKILSAMAIAHRTHLWDSLATYRVTFSEEFYGLIGEVGNPFPDAETQIELQYFPGEYTGQLKISSGEDQGLTWGMQNGQTYLLHDDGELAEVDDANIQFWLPTYQYFIEFPWRIQEATHFQYMGTTEIKNQVCEGVLASWNSVEPQRNIDQYIIWISKASNRIVKAEYTIREMYPFLTGAAYFENYQEFDGFLLPTAFPVESNLVNEGLLHTMKILDFKENVLDRKELMPLN